jgi:hypothetical protein
VKIRVPSGHAAVIGDVSNAQRPSAKADDRSLFADAHGRAAHVRRFSNGVRQVDRERDRDDYVNAWT